MKLYINSYSKTSKSAKALAKALNANFIWSKKTRKIPLDLNEKTIIVNWGSSTYYDTPICCSWINNPVNLYYAVSKIRTYNILKDNNISTCEYTQNKEVAMQWLYGQYNVYSRYKDTSSGGRGIIVNYPDKVDEFLSQTPALFYTKGISLPEEYRVHIFENQNLHTFFIQQKIKRDDWQGTYGHIQENYHIHSHSNGYIFVSTLFPVSDPSYDMLREQSIKALKALNLSFGAFDVKYDPVNQKIVFLECNTAPGLFPKTLDFYKKSILEYAKNLN